MADSLICLLLSLAAPRKLQFTAFTPTKALGSRWFDRATPSAAPSLCHLSRSLELIEAHPPVCSAGDIKHFFHCWVHSKFIAIIILLTATVGARNSNQMLDIYTVYLHEHGITQPQSTANPSDSRWHTRSLDRIEPASRNTTSVARACGRFDTKNATPPLFFRFCWCLLQSKPRHNSLVHQKTSLRPQIGWVFGPFASAPWVSVTLNTLIGCVCSCSAFTSAREENVLIPN